MQSRSIATQCLDRREGRSNRAAYSRLRPGDKTFAKRNRDRQAEPACDLDSKDIPEQKVPTADFLDLGRRQEYCGNRCTGMHHDFRVSVVIGSRTGGDGIQEAGK